MSSERTRPDSEQTDRLIGEVLANRYRLEHKLGEGAMGSVYKARHIKVGRAFAVKILHPRLLVDDKVLQRFEREAELAGRLRHANVIGVVDVGETTDGLRYMVMDFAEGPDMSALLGEAPMPPQRIIHLTRQLLEGLFHAHTAGLIHRDFKPENVIVEKDSHGDEVPRIVDFGIAILREGGDSSTGPGRLTTNGLVLGTPHYMAPEQAVNDPIDHRIDLFALGIMIYEMLCGKLPFDGNGAEVARANLMLDPPPISVRVPYLDVDPLLEAYARRLMAKNRDTRPPTAKVARELLDLVERDREAAGAALGIPLTAVVRAPRATEPVMPRGNIDDNYPGTFPPPFRANVATPPQAPPMGAPVARLSREHDVSTQPTDPLDDEPPQSRKKLAILGVLVGVAAVVTVIAIAVTHGHDEPGRAPIATIAPAPVPVPAPVPAPIEPPTPIAPPPTGSAVAPAPPVVDPKPPIAKPSPPAHHPAPPRLPPKRSVATTTKIAAPPVPIVRPAAAYDDAAFVSQLKSVGAELRTFADAHPGTVDDLQTQFMRIHVNPALGSQVKRDAARAILDQIHILLAQRSTSSR